MTRPPRAPIWQPLKPSVFGNRYFRYSPKLNAPINSASRLQHECGYLHDWDETVETFVPEPGYATAYIDGRWRRSRFDFWVRFRSGSERYEEVKYAQELGPETRADRQIAVQKAWCAERGIAHTVITDREVWVNPILLNSLTTLFAEYDIEYPRRREAAEKLSPSVLAYITKAGSAKICDVVGVFSKDVGVACARLCVFESIRLRRVCADLENIRLSPLSPLKLK